jgi:hypothetical protein
MLYGDIMVFAKNQTEHSDTLRGQNSALLMLNRAVDIRSKHQIVKQVCQTRLHQRSHFFPFGRCHFGTVATETAC